LGINQVVSNTTLFEVLFVRLPWGVGGRDDIDLAHMSLKQFYEGVRKIFLPPAKNINRMCKSCMLQREALPDLIFTYPSLLRTALFP
jgi:hypothetical protein